jgi:putative SOS response-associated peptidase YedK
MRSDGRRFSDSKRCLIPASAFFEFTGTKSPKSKWRFALSGSPVMAVAGLWRETDGGHAFTMLTTEPGPDIKPFHDRQIVVLRPERWGDWLYLSRREREVLAMLPARSLDVELVKRGCEPIEPQLERFIASGGGAS